jgi:hypothetical protein
MSARLAAMALALAVLVGLTGHARAERWGLFIGANVGLAGEQDLQFAERDAARMAEVFVRFGRLPREQAIVLKQPTARDIGRALEAIEVESRAGPTTLFVYYSGHADRTGLHLGGERFEYAALKALVRAIETELVVVILDACQAGGLIQARGARVERAVPIGLAWVGEAPSRGVAYLTSAAADEDAQEAERLRGGVFTHHLVAGLMGAADRDGDDRVSLVELSRHAYTQTLASTSRTSVVQHPAFAFELVGAPDPILTETHRTGLGSLRLEVAGRYVIERRAGGSMGLGVYEVDVTEPISLGVDPGLLLVRRLTTSVVHEGEVAVLAGQVTTVGSGSLEPVAFRHAVRKGYSPSLTETHTLGVALEVHGPLLSGYGPNLGVAIGYQADFADLGVQARVRYLSSSASNDSVVIDQWLLGLDASLHHMFGIGNHGLGFGVRLGVDWLAQRFTGDGDTPGRDQVVARAGPFVRLELALGESWAMNVDGGFETYWVERGGREPRFVPFIGIGLDRKLSP